MRGCKSPFTVAFIRIPPLQTTRLNPCPRDRAETENPAVELLQRPAAFFHALLFEAEQFVFAEKIAHGNGRRGGVPIHVALCAGGGETNVTLQMTAGSSVIHRAGLEAAINEDAMRAPEGVVKLAESSVGVARDAQ